MLQRYESNLQASPAVVVGVAQLVERQTVDLDVAGSNPVTHPIFQLLTLTQPATPVFRLWILTPPVSAIKEEVERKREYAPVSSRSLVVD